MTLKTAIRGLILAFLALLAPWPVAALDIEFNGGPVRRDILAIYDSHHEKTPQTSRIHQFAEMPLNWLGFQVSYFDVNGPLPPLDKLAKYRGIVTWFIEPLEGADRYLTWLDTATAQGLKLTIFSDLAPGQTSRTADRIAQKIHARLGLDATADHISVTHRAKLIINQPETVSAGAAFVIQAAIEDQYGNVVTTATNSVTVSLASNPGGSTLGGTTTASAVGGYVTFSNLTLNRRGKGYKIRLTSAGLTSATTNAFNVT